MVKIEKKKRNAAAGAGTGTPVNLADTSTSFHILGLDLFQETSESLRTLTNPKDREASSKAARPQTLYKPCGTRIRLGDVKPVNGTSFILLLFVA